MQRTITVRNQHRNQTRNPSQPIGHAHRSHRSPNKIEHRGASTQLGTCQAAFPAVPSTALNNLRQGCPISSQAIVDCQAAFPGHPSTPSNTYERQHFQLSHRRLSPTSLHREFDPDCNTRCESNQRHCIMRKRGRGQYSTHTCCEL
jgi:hypothetical protein